MNVSEDRADRSPSDQVTPIAWSAFRSEIVALYQPPMVAKPTARKTLQVLREIEGLDLRPDPSVGSEPVRITSTADLTVLLVTKIIAGRPPGQSAYTLNSFLASIRAICSYAETSGYLRVSPFRLRKLSRWVRLPMLQDKRCLSRAEIRRILDLMAKHVEERTAWPKWRSRRLLVTFAIAVYCGLRKMEILRLEVDDVDLANRVIWVRPHAGRQLKTRASEAPIPVPDALLPYILEWQQHRLDAPRDFPMPPSCPYFIPTLNRRACWVSGQPGGKALDRLQAVARQAGVEGATFQACRRAWATHAEYFGLGESMVARVLRHTTTATSKKHYRQAEIVNMNAAVKDFNF
jgi:integrase